VGLGDPAFAIRNGELSLARLFDQDMLGDDLEAWLAESALMMRTFRQCACTWVCISSTTATWKRWRTRRLRESAGISC
jgi:Lhr-like helicase